MLFSDDTAWSRFREILMSWYGTPYRHLAMVKGRGADCSLFIAACLAESGILKQVDYDYYPRDWHVHTRRETVKEGFLTQFDRNMSDGFSIRWLNADPLCRGDILTFGMSKTGVTNHAGVYLENTQMIHSAEHAGVSVIRLGSFFRKRLRDTFRIVRS